MKKFLRQSVCVISSVLLCFSFLFAEDENIDTKPDWKLALEDFYSYKIAPDENHFVICNNIEDECSIDMYDMHSGNKIWTKNLKGLSDEKFYDLWRFVSDDIFFAGDEGGYLFLNVNNGSIIKSIPLVCESWDDILLKTGKVATISSPSTNYGKLSDVISEMIMHPIFISDYGIFFSKDGFQVINFAKQNVLYQSTQKCGKIATEKYYENSDESTLPVLKIKIFSGTGMISGASPDSAYALDYEHNKLYTFYSPNGEITNKDVKPNDRLYITNYSHKTDRIDFCLDLITYTNLTTNTIEKTLKINPNAPDFITPILFNDRLCFVTSQNKIQTLYDGKTLSPIFQTNPGDLPGIIDQFYILGNDDVLLFVYNNDDSKMSIGRINSKTGSLVWKSTLFKYDGSYKPGHQKESAGMFTLKMLGASVLSSTLQIIDPLHREYTPNTKVIISSLNTEKSSEGYANILSVSNDTLIIVANGKINSLQSKGSDNDNNGEGIISIDLKTGRTINNYSCPIIASSEINNVIDNLTYLYFPQFNANIIVGANDIYIQRDENIERISFNKSRVHFIVSDSISITIAVYDENENNSDYWRIVVGENRARKILLARSKLDPIYIENIFFSLFSPLLGSTKYDEFPCSLYIDEDGISGYKLIESAVISEGEVFSNPLWKFSFEELGTGTMDIESMCDDFMGEIKDNPNFNPGGEIQGLIVNKDCIIILGSEGICYIKPDGTCKWTKEWEPDISESKVGVNLINGCIFYAIGDITKMYSMDCTGKTLMSIENDYSDTFIRNFEDDRGILVRKSDSGFEFYKFK